MTYEEWIAPYAANKERLMGACKWVCELMMKKFPELKIVPGHVQVPEPWGKRGHFWLVDPEGNIVDPTAAQFPGILSYEPWTDDEKIRVGKCMNCGDDIWRKVKTLEDDVTHGECICSPACGKEFEDYLNRKIAS